MIEIVIMSKIRNINDNYYIEIFEIPEKFKDIIMNLKKFGLLY